MTIGTKYNIENSLFEFSANSEPKGIELLSPAANKEVGIAAINAGADALYIGGDRFSARAAAGNSIEDIAELCSYARPFGVRVYLALNTMLEGEKELREAKDLALRAIDAGVSAIIFQDVRLLDFNLPIEMHASTQTFIENANRACDFKEAGVQRLVVERGFTLAEIKKIADEVQGVDIEAFVQGAICVGYSGVCGLSEYLTGRSGNRGVCAQPCRSRYSLVDANGKVLIKDSALLSPKDLNLSSRVGELIEAGVTSLKIEGRLKEADYVVNSVAYYNDILNSMGVKRSSWGRASAKFTPNLELTFNRSFTQWFLDGVASEERRGSMLSTRRGVESGAVGGQFIGTVKRMDIQRGLVEIDNSAKVELANGDGLSFRDSKSGELSGVRLNRVENLSRSLYLLSLKGLDVGSKIYRNSSTGFKPVSERKIKLDMKLSQALNRGEISYDLEVYASEMAMKCSFELNFMDVDLAANLERMKTNFISAFAKSGGSIFGVERVEVEVEELPFLPMKELNGLRREILDLVSMHLEGWYSQFRAGFSDTGVGYDSSKVKNLRPEYLMRTRYCVLREFGLCLRYNRLAEPLVLENNGRQIALRFDCGECMMELHRV